MKTSKLREDAAQFLRSAGLNVEGGDIDCVAGHNKRVDCQRFEFIDQKTRIPYGCWLTLAEFVKECRKHGGAAINPNVCEVWPAYPPDSDKDSACPLCGEDGGTGCGMPNCQY